MKTRKVDTLREQNARQLLGSAVLDARGEKIGTMEGLWIDFSTHQIAFIGVKSSLLSRNVRVVPAGNARVQEGGKAVVVEYSKDFIENAPAFDPDVNFAEVERER